MGIQRTLLAVIEEGLEEYLVRVAVQMGALDVGGPLSGDEERLVQQASTSLVPAGELNRLRQAIASGHDPLGAILCSVRGPLIQRKLGAFYTPQVVIRPMVEWILDPAPGRVVDAGCGSGRFTTEIVRQAPGVSIVAVDIDPLATLLTRSALAVLRHRDAIVMHADYTAVELARITGRTGFVGNPPYVRHHDLPPSTKRLGRALAQRLGYAMSSLAGLHAYFYLATAVNASAGDVGCFVTSAEWLDVGYGALVRNLLQGRLSGRSIDALAPTAVAFADAMTTAAVTCFEVGAPADGMNLRIVNDLRELEKLGAGRRVSSETLAHSKRWSQLVRSDLPAATDGMAPLREIARVHRGVVTGANAFFLLTPLRARQLGLEQWCRPAITKAHEILSADGVVRSGPERRLLLDVPGDIDRSAHPALNAYLHLGEQSYGGRAPVCDGYICRHRRPWWRLGTLPAPPVVVSYMARQAPAFALNPDRLVLVNIAHGLYPVRDLDDAQLADLVSMLNERRGSFRGSGRTYHGGMEKFEPGEIENLLVSTERLGL